MTYTFVVRGNEHRWVRSKLSAPTGRFRCPFDGQKNGNTTSKLPENSMEIDGMSSPPKVQPGERRE